MCVCVRACARTRKNDNVQLSSVPNSFLQDRAKPGSEGDRSEGVGSRGGGQGRGGQNCGVVERCRTGGKASAERGVAPP